MEHDFNHKAETFDSPKNIFLANLVCQAVEKQIDLLSDKEILDASCMNNRGRYLSEFLNFPSTKKLLRNIAKSSVNQFNIKARSSKYETNFKIF